MRFDKIFGPKHGFDEKRKKPTTEELNKTYQQYFDFLRLLNINYDKKGKEVEYLEKGEVYLGIGKDGLKKSGVEIIVYGNPIEWSGEESASKTIGMLRIDKEKFLELEKKLKGKRVEEGMLTNKEGAGWLSVDGARGSFKDSEEDSHYTKYYHLYPLLGQVGIINWMW